MRERGVERMLVILGASGSGKSSFLRAGLWPRLRRDDRHFLALPVIRPERSVTGSEGIAASLEMACRNLAVPRTRGQIRGAVREPGGFARLLGQLQESAAARLEPGAPPPTIVISVDQASFVRTVGGR